MIPRPRQGHARADAGLEVQAGPAREDGRRVDAVDDDELPPACGAGDEAHPAPRDPELPRDQADERDVRVPIHGGRPDACDEHAVDDPVDMVRPGTRGEPDGEADVGRVQRLTGGRG